jgi:hypothetical protein
MICLDQLDDETVFLYRRPCIQALDMGYLFNGMILFMVMGFWMVAGDDYQG